MDCPKCNSDDTVRCKTAYEQGNVTTKSSGGNLHIGRIGMTSTQTSEFAKHCRPPKKPKAVGEYIFSAFWLFVIGCAPMFLAVIFLVEPNDLSPWIPIGIGAVGLLFWSGVVNCYFLWGKYKREERDKDIYAYLNYDYKWICKRCGETYYDA